MRMYCLETLLKNLVSDGLLCKCILTFVDVMQTIQLHKLLLKSWRSRRNVVLLREIFQVCLQINMVDINFNHVTCSILVGAFFLVPPPSANLTVSGSLAAKNLIII